MVIFFRQELTLSSENLKNLPFVFIRCINSSTHTKQKRDTNLSPKREKAFVFTPKIKQFSDIFYHFLGGTLDILSSTCY